MIRKQFFIEEQLRQSAQITRYRLVRKGQRPYQSVRPRTHEFDSNLA